MFSEMENALDEIRFDKCRIERKIETIDKVSGISSQEERIIIADYIKIRLDESTSMSTGNTIQGIVTTDITPTYKVLCRTDIDIQTGDYLFIKRNFFLGKDIAEVEFKAGQPQTRPSHLEVPVFAEMEA